jgi:hypothetical protein
MKMKGRKNRRGRKVGNETIIGGRCALRIWEKKPSGSKGREREREERKGEKEKRSHKIL